MLFILEKRIILKQDEITEINLSIENENYYLQEECICFAFLDCIMNENYSLAIGKKGQNVKLASRLTKYKIAIKKAGELDEE